MNKLDANYLKWAKESNRKSTLRNFLISELVAFEKEMNHFDAKDFKNYNKIKKNVDSTIQKLCKLED